VSLKDEYIAGILDASENNIVLKQIGSSRILRQLNFTLPKSNNNSLKLLRKIQSHYDGKAGNVLQNEAEKSHILRISNRREISDILNRIIPYLRNSYLRGNLLLEECNLIPFSTGPYLGDPFIIDKRLDIIYLFNKQNSSLANLEQESPVWLAGVLDSLSTISFTDKNTFNIKIEILYNRDLFNFCNLLNESFPKRKNNKCVMVNHKLIKPLLEKVSTELILNKHSCSIALSRLNISIMKNVGITDYDDFLFLYNRMKEKVEWL